MPALVGCEYVPRRSTVGDLGKAHFNYECQQREPTLWGSRPTWPDDFACTTNTGTLPSRIALGAHFTVSAWRDRALFSDSPTPALAPASPEMVASKAGELIAQRSGTTALLATTGDEALDFTHVRILPIDHLDLQQLPDAITAPDALLLTEGDSVTLGAVPVDSTRASLAGTLDYRWSSSNVNAVMVSANGRTADLRGVFPGRSEVTVSVGPETSAMKRTVLVTVEAAP